MKENKPVTVLPGKLSPVIKKYLAEKEPPAFLNVKLETQFCHFCGGWCVIDYGTHKLNCPVCLGRGTTTVLLPAGDELALAE